MNELLSIQERVSGWGQSFVPPIERIFDHVGKDVGNFRPVLGYM